MKGESIRSMNPVSDTISRNYLLIGLFAVAMAALEAIVVVYLRQLYYPLGFDFPLTMLTSKMVSIEWIREAATIVMLIAIGMIAGRTSLQRFAWFLYCFAVWDIFYYIWLKLILNWPASLLTWDILFLIPVPWISPVVAPVICSLTMILLGAVIIYLQSKSDLFHVKPFEWILMVIGVIIILITFMWDYASIIIKDGLLSKFWVLTNDTHLLSNVLTFIPTTYSWGAFMVGEIFILAAIVSMVRRSM